MMVPIQKTESAIGRSRSRRRRRRQSAKNRVAATLVEFSIVANVLFLVVFTCIEFARMNMVRNLTQDAAYFAARHALVPGATSGEAEAEADRIMASMMSQGYEVDVSPLNDSSEEVVVTVSVDLDQIALFTPMFLGNQQIQSTARLRTERYSGFFEQ